VHNYHIAKHEAGHLLKRTGACEAIQILSDIAITYRSLRWKIKKDNPIYPHKFRYTPKIESPFEGALNFGYEISMDKSFWSTKNSYILIV
jgi:hypothetical protein